MPYAPVPEDEDDALHTALSEALAGDDAAISPVDITASFACKSESQLDRSTELASVASDSSALDDNVGRGIVVHGVRAGAGAVKELTRIFSVFGSVDDVVVRKRFEAPQEGSDADAGPTTVETSWALVTM